MPCPPTKPLLPPPFAAELAAPLVLPLIEETAVVSRELVETGRVVLTKTVTEHTETLPLALRHDEVRVERVPINAVLPADAPTPEVRYEGNTMIVPVLREVMVKHLVLVEELHVTNHQVTTDAPQTVTLRREDVVIERLPPAATDPR